MFRPTTNHINKTAERYPERIKRLDDVFDKPSIVYIDFANVFYWQSKLGWHIDLKRLKDLLGGFETIKETKLYNGILEGEPKSEDIIKHAKEYGYTVITKPVKNMKLEIDVSSITPNSPDILKRFVSASLLRQFKLETIEYLNNRLRELNQQGILFIEERKCNFDVEIGRDLYIDYYEKKAENYILWSGDSDFVDPIRHLLKEGKKVVLFSTTRRVASELSELREQGLQLFDIQKLREFICWPRENR